MKTKSGNVGGNMAKKRLQWRPANALTVGATSRAAWSKGGGKRQKNPRGRPAQKRT